MFQDAFLSTSRLVGLALKIRDQASMTSVVILYWGARQPKVKKPVARQGRGEISGTG